MPENVSKTMIGGLYAVGAFCMSVGVSALTADYPVNRSAMRIDAQKVKETYAVSVPNTPEVPEFLMQQQPTYFGLFDLSYGLGYFMLFVSVLLLVGTTLYVRQEYLN